MQKKKPLTLPEIAEIYQAALSKCEGDKERARACLEAYLAGYDHMLPVRCQGELLMTQTEPTEAALIEALQRIERTLAPNEHRPSPNEAFALRVAREALAKAGAK